MKMAQQMAKFSPIQGFDVEIVKQTTIAIKLTPLVEQQNSWPIGCLLTLYLCSIFHRKAKKASNEIGVVALRVAPFWRARGPLYGDFEELSISHRALSRTLFAKGVLVLSSWVAKAELGKHHGLQSIELDEIQA